MGSLILFLAVVIAVAFLSRRTSRRRGGGLRPGPATMGTIYDFLNEEKRNAIEIIVEQKAEARDPEDAEGNLPDLEKPRRP